MICSTTFKYFFRPTEPARRAFGQRRLQVGRSRVDGHFVDLLELPAHPSQGRRRLHPVGGFVLEAPNSLALGIQSPPAQPDLRLYLCLRMGLPWWTGVDVKPTVSAQAR